MNPGLGLRQKHALGWGWGGAVLQQREAASPQELCFALFCFVFNLFYFWLCWDFIATRGLSLVAASGVYSSLQCVGFSLRWLLLWSTCSRRVGFSSCGSRALERRLSSCGSRA